MGSRIVATGRALPRTAVANSDLARVMDTSGRVDSHAHWNRYCGSTSRAGEAWE
jgi:hypothetical protein